MSSLVLALGDTHAPWIYWATIDAFVKRVAETAHLPNVVVVQLGDLYDMFSWTRFPRTQSIYTPLAEMKKGREVGCKIWQRIVAANPNASRYQLLGNHDVRPYKRVLEKMPEAEPLLGFNGHFQFEGVETILDVTEDLLIDGNSYTHGFTCFGKHVDFTHRNTVTGHLHRGNVTYVRRGKRSLWEANAGLSGNPKSVPLSYGALKRYNKTTQGWVEVDARGPRFIATANP